MKNAEEKEFQDLLQQAIDGDLSVDESRRLQDLARGNKARLEELVDHALIASLLFEEGSEESVGDLVDFVASEETEAKLVRARFTGFASKEIVAAVAAIVVLTFISGLIATRSFTGNSLSVKEELDHSVAQLTESVGVVWEGDIRPTAGASLVPGVLRLAEGMAQIDFYSGARVIVEGPAELELVSAYSAWCRSGRIRARVPEQARGFKIFTPSFELVDLGTEFGIDLSKDGEGQVRVFDGEVELYSSNRKRSVLGGQEVKISSGGESDPVSISEAPEGRYPTFNDLQNRASEAAVTKLESWHRWNQSLKGDSRITARFDFEKRTIPDAAVVGCGWVDGRWPGKGALEFRRAGDRVRVNIPGEFDNLSLLAWIRVDTAPPRHQALLLTDQYQVGHIHWQIGPNGEMKLGAKERIVRVAGKQAASVVRVFDTHQLGGWNLVGTTFDRKARIVRHFFNGREVSSHEFRDLPLQIGSGDIGNWSVQLTGARKSNPKRNFVGRMDEMTIWNVTLTAEEIADRYSKFKP